MRFFTPKRKILLLGFFLLVNGILAGFLWQERQSDIFYQEIHDFADQKIMSFQDVASYFSDLAFNKGAGYAFEVLKQAPMPQSIDMHLLAHVVGDILYSQEGAEGVRICTHDFRNACSHSIVIGLFTEKGQAALPEIAETCYEAPGGSGAYTMCFHGLGHGILAYTGYNLIDAVNICKKTGTAAYNNEESSQCISGAIMEVINGVHDRELWEKEHKKYFKKEDPLYPCTADFIPERARPLCYLYLTPHLFKSVGVDMGAPLPADFEKAFKLCEGIPESDFANRDSCYGGFGKEFTVLALGRDIRLSSIEDITKEQFERVYEWCLFSEKREGAVACVVHAMQSLYWGGENDRGIALGFCSAVSDPYYEKSCFMNLIGAVFYYVKDEDYQRVFCQELPLPYQEACKEKL